MTKNNQVVTELATSLCISFQSARDPPQAVGTGGVGGESRIPTWSGVVRQWVYQKAAEGSRTYPHPQVSEAIGGQSLMQRLITSQKADNCDC